MVQLLQIYVEKVQLKSFRRCGFSQSPHAQEASILLVFFLHRLRHTLLGSVCCMQTYFYQTLPVLLAEEDHEENDWQVSLHYHSSRTKENKKDSHIYFKDLDLLYHLMPHIT